MLVHIIVTVIVVIILHTCKYNWLLQSELPDTFSIQVNMRRVVFMSLYTSFSFLLVEEGRKGNIGLYKALISNFKI